MTPKKVESVQPNRRTGIRWFFTALVAANTRWALAGTIGPNPHPFHICIGEMDWNESSSIWEVSLRVHPSDLQNAVRRYTSSEIEIDSDKEAPPELLQYLDDHIGLVSLKEQAAELRQIWKDAKAMPRLRQRDPDRVGSTRFVGSEIQRGWLWMHLEWTEPKQTDPLYLVHRILIDDVEEQTNTILVRRDSQRWSLRFSADDTIAEMPKVS